MPGMYRIKLNSHIRSLRQHIEESKEIHSRCTSLRRSVYAAMWTSIAVLALTSSVVYVTSGPGLGMGIFLWTLITILIFTAFVLLNLPLVRDPAGGLKLRLGAANILTALRFFLIAPVLLLLSRGLWMWGIVVYSAAVLLDVLDGMAARHLQQETLIGVVLDPLGDIFLTGSLFLFLWIEGTVPLWLFIILMARYGQFFAGLAALASLGAVPRLKATMAGKVVGVVQALGIIILLAGKLLSASLPFSEINLFLFPVLGVAFSSVIVSQSVIGWRALRNSTRGAG